jgi:hypothetical protein
MLQSNSLALHVRRGDYLSNRQSAAIYRNLSLEYYRHCVLDQLAERSDITVYVFSNDIAWCREKLILPCPTQFIQHTTNVTAYEDLWLMTAARSHVIANSTFSWWGAWLRERTEGRVYAPESWFYPGTLDDRYLACNGWSLVVDPALRKRAA